MNDDIYTWQDALIAFIVWGLGGTAIVVGFAGMLIQLFYRIQ